MSRIDLRIAALAGQVTAAATLAAAAARAGRSGWLYGRPSRGGGRTARAVASDVARIWESASLHSPAGRHAVRLAVVVAGTELLVQRLGLPRGYWAVVAAATVLRPSFGATFTRGAERALGTLAGVVIATLIADAIDPGGWAIVAVVGVLAFYTFAVFPRELRGRRRRADGGDRVPAARGRSRHRRRSRSIAGSTPRSGRQSG